MSNNKKVVYSMWWRSGAGDSALVVDVLGQCGFPLTHAVGGDDGQIMNFLRASAAPDRTAKAVLAVALDELHAQGLPLPTDVVVFTPDDDQQVYYWPQ